MSKKRAPLSSEVCTPRTSPLSLRCAVNRDYDRAERTSIGSDRRACDAATVGARRGVALGNIVIRNVTFSRISIVDQNDPAVALRTRDCATPTACCDHCALEMP